MNTMAMLTYDPGPASTEQRSHQDARELNETKDGSTISGLNPQADIEELTDYSYDPDEEWIQMHLGNKMEENY